MVDNKITTTIVIKETYDPSQMLKCICPHCDKHVVKTLKFDGYSTNLHEMFGGYVMKYDTREYNYLGSCQDHIVLLDIIGYRMAFKKCITKEEFEQIQSMSHQL